MCFVHSQDPPSPPYYPHSVYSSTRGVTCSEVEWPRCSSSVASQDVQLYSSRVEKTNVFFAMLLPPARAVSCVRTWAAARQDVVVAPAVTLNATCPPAV